MASPRPHVALLMGFAAVDTIALFQGSRPASTQPSVSAVRSASPRTEEQSKAALANWLTDEGGYLDGVCVRSHRGLRGLFTTSEVSSGQPVLAIPRHCTLHVFEDANSGFLVHELLVMRLLTARKNGELPVYLNTLPSEVPLLRDWSSEALDLLQSPKIVSEVTSQRDRLDRCCERVKDALVDDADWSQPPSQDELRWAESIVRSRALACEMHGRRGLMLVPFFDLCNHRTPSERRLSRCGGDGDAGGRSPDVLQTADDMVVLCASTALPRHAELHISYGDVGNAGLLLDYGFAELLSGSQRSHERLHLGRLADALRRGAAVSMARCLDGTERTGMAWDDVDARHMAAAALACADEEIVIGTPELDAHAARRVRSGVRAKSAPHMLGDDDANTEGEGEGEGASKRQVEMLACTVLRAACAAALNEKRTSEAADVHELRALQARERDAERKAAAATRTDDDVMAAVEEAAAEEEAAAPAVESWQRRSALHFRLGEKRQLRRTAEELDALLTKLTAGGGGGAAADACFDNVEAALARARGMP
eukprot:5755930-Pleurochrysis_carterae.AAC.1